MTRPLLIAARWPDLELIARKKNLGFSRFFCSSRPLNENKRKQQGEGDTNCS